MKQCAPRSTCRRGHGVQPSDYPDIVAAATLHCHDIEPTDNLVVNILKDADALDRVRLGDLDLSRLRLKQSHALLSLAESMHETMVNDGGDSYAHAIAALHLARARAS